MHTKFAIIASKTDPAGMSISTFLIKKHGFGKTEERFEGSFVHHNRAMDAQLVFIPDTQIFADYVDSVDAEVVVFASKHKSESAKPTLTVHAIGNWGEAEMGGRDKTLVPTSAALIKNYLAALQKEKTARNLSYEVSLECSHHGPLLGKPTVYIELGSSEKQWADAKAAEAIADVIAGSTSLEGAYKTAIAIGGGHYCPEFTKLVLRTDYALSHICPKYALENLNEALLKQAIEKTQEGVQEIVLDYKGLGDQKEKVQKLLEGQELPVQRVRKLPG